MAGTHIPKKLPGLREDFDVLHGNPMKALKQGKGYNTVCILETFLSDRSKGFPVEISLPAKRFLQGSVPLYN